MIDGIVSTGCFASPEASGPVAVGGGPSPTALYAIFMRIASQADGDRSFASTYLGAATEETTLVSHTDCGPVKVVIPPCRALTYLTSGISFAYRIERRPVAERASRMVIFGALNLDYSEDCKLRYPQSYDVA